MQVVWQVVCIIVEVLVIIFSCKQQVLDLFISYLDELSIVGECVVEYLVFYQKFIIFVYWKVYLVVWGVLFYVGNFIIKEIVCLLVLEEVILSIDLQQGYVFKSFIGFFFFFVEVEFIKRYFKSCLVGIVLNGYLCLWKLVVQRIKLIDEMQDMLLEMLEDMIRYRIRN